ncbi:MAG: CopD family protein [Dethiobacter sp.]|nr:CopD family protein [Dethiobacter sp.]
MRFFHIVAAFIWLGAIFYIHLVMTPKAVAGGIPQATLKLAWLNIVIIFVTGSVLAAFRLGSWAGFTGTRFGQLLSIKIFLFLILVAAAAFVTLRLNRALKTGAPIILHHTPAGKMFTEQDLSRFDGSDGKRIFVAFGGHVYDVSQSRLWKSGKHAGRHPAGTDLSSDMAEAPHGPDMLERFPIVGKLTAAGSVVSPSNRGPAKALYLLAYFNLL